MRLNAKYNNMKLKLILAILTLTVAFSSCKKCQTCVPYHYNMGVKGAIDNNTTQTLHGYGAQQLTLCDKTDIDAYESLTTFTDAQRDSVRFYCN